MAHSSDNNARANILIIMTDQQRADSCPPWGRAKMPRLERFARESTSFTRAYCPSPHCCPSRASFFTSLYPSQHRVRNNVINSQSLSEDLRDGVSLWSDLLIQNGYSLHFTGKWHVSKNKDPKDFGWQQGVCARLGSNSDTREGSWNLYQEMGPVASVPERRAGAIERPGYGPWLAYGTATQSDEDSHFADDAERTLTRLKDAKNPWCYYIGFIGPHDPYFVEEEYLDLYRSDDIELPISSNDSLEDKPNIYRRLREQIWDQLSSDESKVSLLHYLAYCSKMDAYFGRVMDALDASGQSDNTLVVFCSDHGDYAGDHGLWCKGIAAFDSAYRVPLLIRSPKNQNRSPRTNDNFVSLCDIGPTLLEATGCCFDSAQFTGRSLMPMLNGAVPADWRQSICFQCDGVELYYTQRAITTRKWKYVFNGFDFDELYDLESDPHEMINLARKTEYAPLIEDLCREMWGFARKVDDTAINAYITVGLAPNGPRSVFEI